MFFKDQMISKLLQINLQDYWDCDGGLMTRRVLSIYFTLLGKSQQRPQTRHDVFNELPYT
jgi:hypothetical protein